MKINLEAIGIENINKPVTWEDLIKVGGGYVACYPLIGKTAYLDGERICEYDVRGEGNIDIAYEWSKESGELIRIYIGHKYAGPMLEWSHHRNDGKGAWVNLYSKGNYGDRWACGGGWSSDARRLYKTPVEALAYRDYLVSNLEMERNKFQESSLLLDEVRDWLRGLEEGST